MNSRHIRFALAASTIATLAACGGGDDSSATPQVNVFEMAQGVYTVACDGYSDPTGGLNASWSSRGSITIEGLVGSDGATATIHSLDYGSPKGDLSGGSCTDTALTEDLTVKGQIRDLGTTKLVKRADGSSVAAKVLEFRFDAVTFSKGSFTGTLPAFGTTTRVPYLLVGNQLYLAKGGRDADGLAGELSPRVGVKQ